jgi:hypothetical protein
VRREPRWADDSGFIAGAEALPFGVLIFLVGSLMVFNAWAVIDAKVAVAASVREAVRAYVEAPEGSSPHALAEAAAVRTLTAHGRPAGPMTDLSVSGTFERCAPVTVSMGYRIPAIVLPWRMGLGDVTVRSAASEIVDPLRSGLEGEASCVPVG